MTQSNAAVQLPSLPAGEVEASTLGLARLYETLGDYAGRMALRFTGPAALIGGLLAWAINAGRNPVPFTSDMQGFGVLIFAFGLIIAFVVAAVAFVLGVRYRNSLVPAELKKSWVWTVLPLALAHALVIGLFVSLGIEFVKLTFKDLALPTVYANAAVALACGVIAYAVAGQSLMVRAQGVLGLFVTVLLGGIALSAINVNNDLWWTESFSFLGTASSNDRQVFNATMIIAGILLIILQQFLMDDFVELRARGLFSPRKTQIMRISLIALGVLMAIVGLVPFGQGGIRDTVHSFAAYSLAGILLGYMIFVRRLLPYFSREFYAMTWFMVVLLVAAVLLHLLGSINTVGVELLSFAIGGAWFLLFIKHVNLLVDHINRNSQAPASSA